MEKINGTVTSVSQKEGKYGIALGSGNWYNGKGIVPCNKGDNVDITFEVNGDWKNINQVYVTGNAPAAKPGYSSESNQANMLMSKLKNKTNAKICALTCATDLTDKGAQPEVVILTAEQFVKWLYPEE